MPPTKKKAKARSRTTKPKQSSSVDEPAPVQVELSPDDLRTPPIPAESLRVYYRIMVVGEDDTLVDIGNTLDLHKALSMAMLSYTPSELQQFLEHGMLRPAVIQLTEQLDRIKQKLKPIEPTSDAEEALELPDEPPVPAPDTEEETE